MPIADNKIVQMTFKNEQFERGVKESLDSLEKLKKALNLDKSAESLSNLEKIAGSFDISGIAKGVDNIADRFTLLGNIGQEIFHRISRTAVDTMQNVIHTITSMPNAGMSKYEQKNKSVQMIRSAMPNKSIEEIEQVLAKLNEYTDLTSYDFSTMANSIGKFVSAGVDLNVAEKVMEGIANETASAGGEISAANIAMYNFSQALAAGAVKLMDWRSIQNQNLDTKEFKEQIIQTAIAMGKLSKESEKVGYYYKGSGKKIQKVLVDYKSFASTLSNGWFDSDVMIEVFKKYADRESDVGKKGFEAAKVAITLSQAFDAVKDALSTGWMTSFSYIFGNLEEAGDLFTRISDAIIGFTDQISSARNELLRGWHYGGKDGISGYKKMIEGLSNVWSTLMGIVEAGKSAFKDVFGVLESSDLINITKAFADFTGNLKEMFGVSEETVEVSKNVKKAYDPLNKWTHALKKGMKGPEIKQLQNLLLKLKDPEINLGKKAADGIFGSDTEAALKKFQKKVGLAQTGIYDKKTRDALGAKLYPGGYIREEIQTTTETVQVYGTQLDHLIRTFKGIFAVGKSVVDIISSGLKIAGKVIKIFDPVVKGAMTLASGIGDVINYVAGLTTSLTNNETALKKFDVFLKPISDIIGVIGYNMSLAGIGLTALTNVFKQVGNFDAVGKVLKSWSKYSSDDMPWLKYAIGFYNVISTVKNILKPVTDFIGKLGHNLSLAGDGLAGLINIFEKVKNFDAVGDVLRGLEAHNFGKMPWLKYATTFYNVIATIRNVIRNVTPALKNLGKVIGNVFKVLGSLAIEGILKGLDAVGTFIVSLFSTISEGDVLSSVLNGLSKALQIVAMLAAGAGYGIYALANFLVSGVAAIINFVRNSEFLQRILSSITKFATPICEFFSSVFDSIVSITGKIGTFKSFGDAFRVFLVAMKNNPVGKKFVPAILVAVRTLAEFVGKIKNLPNTIKSAFEKAKTILKSAKENIKSFFTNLVPNLKEFGQKVSSAIGNFFSMDTSGIKGLPQKIFARFKAFEPVIDWIKEKISGIKEFLSNPKKLFSNFLSSIQGTVGKAKTSVGGFFSNIFPNISEFGQNIGNAVGDFLSIDISGIQELPQKILNAFQSFNPVIEWIKTKFSTLKDFLMDPKKMLSHVIGALKGIGQFIINIFKNVNLGTIWDAAKSALGTYIMLTFASSLKTLSKSVGILTGAVDKDEKDGLAGKLRSIAITIGIVTAALAGLAFIPADKALAGVGVMALALGAVVGAIVGAIVALNKWAPKTESIGKGILSMALSIGAVLLAIAGAVALVKHGGNLTKPLILIGGILVALGVVAWAMNKFGSKGKKEYSSGTAKTILAMCAGLYLIVEAVDRMSQVIKGNKGNQSVTVGAMISIGLMLAALGTIAVFMSKFGGSTKLTGDGTLGIASTILAICNSLGTIINAVEKVMAIIKANPDNWGQAVGVVEGLLLTMGTISVLLAKFSGDKNFLDTIANTVATVGPIIAMGFFIDKVATTMAEGIQKVSGVDPKIIEDFLEGVGGAFAALISTVMIFSKIGIGGLAQAAAGIVLIMGAIGLGIDIAATFTADAVDKLSSALWLVGSRIGDFSNFVADVNTTKISQVMDLMVNNILPTIVRMASYSEITSKGLGTATNLWLFGEALGLFQDSIKDITVDTGAAIKQLPEDIKATVDSINSIEGIDAAKDVLTNLGGALSLYYGNLDQMNSETPTDENGTFDINKANTAFANLAELTLSDETLKKIKNYATGGEQDLNSFAIGIENLATALKTYGEKVSTLDSTAIGNANDVLDKVMDIDDHINPLIDVNFSILNGKRQTISSFGLDVAALGRALARYADSISSLNPGKILMANVVIDAISTLANHLPTTGGLWQMLTGEQKLGEFATNMSDLGSGMANYANKVSDATFTNVDAATQAVKGLAEAQSILQSNGGLKSLIEGTAGLSDLGTNLVGLGESLTQFAQAEGGIKTLKDADFDRLMKIMEPIKALAEAQSIMQRVGGWDETFSGEVNWSNLTAGLDQEFINKLNTFNETAKSFNANDEHLMSVLNFLERLAFIQSLSVSGVTGFDDLGHGFDALMNFIIRELGSEENGSTIEIIKKNLENLFSAVGDEKSQANLVGAVSVASSAIKTAVDEQAITPATTWGEDLVDNFATGMENKISAAEQAASKVAKVIWSYLHFSKPETGPLKDADTYGGDFLDTFANGMKDNLSNFMNTVSGVASSLSTAFTESAEADSGGFLGKLKSGLENTFNNLISDDIANPVIQPVMDLTNVESGVSDLNGMLSGKSVSVGTDLAKNVMSGNGVTIVQGGAAEDHSPEIIAAINELGNRIVALETQMASNMSNLKVVMNTNALVGQIAPTMDKVLGGYANRR